jgi:hypothetical protein
MRASRLLYWLFFPIGALVVFVDRARFWSYHRAIQRGERTPEGCPLSFATREFIARAEFVEVFALCDVGLGGEAFTSSNVLGRVIVENACMRNFLVKRLLAATEASTRGKPCLDAEYGIRIAVGEQTLDLTICFGCGNVWAHGSEQISGSGNIAWTPLGPVLASILKRAGVALPQSGSHHAGESHE